MDAIARFEREYQEYHNISDGRRVEQKRTLQDLAALAGKPILDCDESDLSSYLATVLQSGRHPNTVAKRLKLVLPFFQWAWRVRLIDAERLMRLRDVSPPSGTGGWVPHPYSPKELRQFRDDLATAWPLVEEKWWTRYRAGSSRYRKVHTEVMRRQIEAIVALALHGGLRAREIYGLSLDDMHHDNAYIVVRQRAKLANGKDKLREVPFTEAARETVERWLDLRASLPVTHDRPWIVATNRTANDPFDPMQFPRFASLIQQAVGPEYGLHRFRHTAATAWLRSEMPIEKVSKLLGHSRVQQTLGYAELVADDLQASVERNEGKFLRLIGEAA